MCVVLVVVIVIHGVSCLCLWGEFLFLCAGGVHLCLVCILLLFGVLSFVLFVANLFVFDMKGDQIVLVYSRMGLVIVLYVMLSVSLDFPQCVVVSAFMM